MNPAGRLPCDEAATRVGAAVPECSASKKRWVLTASVLGSSLAFVDGTVVNVTLPAIQKALGASAYEAQWVVESYALLLAALLLLGGSLGDRYGRRRIFMVGIAVFGVASILCACAQDVHQLIAARALQGAGAALLVPGSLALISVAFPEDERGKAFGTWAGFSGIAAALGPVLGGYLVDNVSWVWAFAVNVPLAVLVTVITWLRVPESRPPARLAPLDVAGTVLVTVGLGGVVFSFIEAPSRGWLSTPVLLAAVIGIAALVTFVFVERRQAAPMLPFELLRNRNFAGANMVTLLLYAALGGGLFFVPLNLIQVQGLSATAAGAALLPFVLIMFLLSRWSGGLVEVHGARGPLVVGPLITASSFALLVLPGTASSYWLGFLPSIALLGVGMAVAIAPLTTVVMNSVEQNLIGTASGINNALSRVAGLLAIAVFGWLMASVFEPRLKDAIAQMPPSVATQFWVQRDKLAAIEIPATVDHGIARSAHDAVKHALVAGYRWIMAVSAALALGSAVVAALWIEARPSRGSAQKKTNAPIESGSAGAAR